MSKRRIKFSKTGMGKYISHLDLLRTFTRTINRSGLPVKYSQGFNPHQLITFSLPLPIGVTSVCEYVDIDFADTVSDAEIMEKLNQNLPMDMRILAVGSIVHKANTICAAEYKMVMYAQQKVEEGVLDAFFSSSEIWVEKKTKKKGNVQVNLMEFVKEWCYLHSSALETSIAVQLCAGGEKSIKPEIFAEALLSFLKQAGIEVQNLQIERTEIFCKEDGKEILFS